MTRFNSKEGCFETSSKAELCRVKYTPEMQLDISDMYGLDLSHLLQVMLDREEQNKNLGEFVASMSFKDSRFSVELTKKAK